jgi:hypothetical protein
MLSLADRPSVEVAAWLGVCAAEDMVAVVLQEQV